MRLNSVSKIIPWLSLSWGIFSVFLITHNVWGIHKVVLFAALFAGAALVSLALPRGQSKIVDWVKLASQQSSAQYILFFAAPLLWRSGNWFWFSWIGVLALSTLWDPLYNSLWERVWYRLLLITSSLAIVVALSVVTWAPFLLQHSAAVAFGICLISQLAVSFGTLKSSQFLDQSVQLRRNQKSKIVRHTAPALVLFGVFATSPTPIPPIGVWLAEGRIEANYEDKSLECTTRIAAPAGFKSGIVHHWSMRDSLLMRDEVSLSEVVGNGIEEKPFTTRSRKKVFPIPFEEITKKTIRCSVSIPGNGRIGLIEAVPLPRKNPN